MKFEIPEKRSKKWYIFLIVMTLILTFILSISYYSIIKYGLTGKNVLGFLIVSYIIALITSIFGYFGFKIIFLSSCFSSIAGVLYMLYMFSRNLEGWESIVGLLVLTEIFAFGTIFGIIAEIILYIITKTKKGRK